MPRGALQEKSFRELDDEYCSRWHKDLDASRRERELRDLKKGAKR